MSGRLGRVKKRRLPQPDHLGKVLSMESATALRKAVTHVRRCGNDRRSGSPRCFQVGQSLGQGRERCIVAAFASTSSPEACMHNFCLNANGTTAQKELFSSCLTLHCRGVLGFHQLVPLPAPRTRLYLIFSRCVLILC